MCFKTIKLETGAKVLSTLIDCFHIAFSHSGTRFSEVLFAAQACWKQRWCLLFLLALLSLVVLSASAL